MELDDAAQLVALAEAKGLTLATAPANALSDAHRLCRRRSCRGRHRHAAAGLCRNGGRSGLPRQLGDAGARNPARRWPGLHEFEIGCTLEHAGYALSWLVSLFGAVESLTAFSALTFPDKGPGTRDDRHGAGFLGRLPAVSLRPRRQADLGPCRAKGSIADHHRRQGLDRGARPLGQPLGGLSSRNWQAAQAVGAILVNAWRRS